MQKSGIVELYLHLASNSGSTETHHIRFDIRQRTPGAKYGIVGLPENQGPIPVIRGYPDAEVSQPFSLIRAIEYADLTKNREVQKIN